MTHEPECPNAEELYDPESAVLWPAVCHCDILRSAYQRGREDADRWCNVADTAYRKGREDAAEAVLNKLLSEPTPNEWDAGFNVAIYEAAAAARGEGAE